jgi:hypothetical protein
LRTWHSNLLSGRGIINPQPKRQSAGKVRDFLLREPPYHGDNGASAVAEEDDQPSPNSDFADNEPSPHGDFADEFLDMIQDWLHGRLEPVDEAAQG